MNENLKKNLTKKSFKLRKKIFQSIYDGNGGHLGGAFSVIDILTYLYSQVLKIDPKDPNNKNRDRLIFSKGHASQALYWTLAEFSFFDEVLIETYGQDGSTFSGHPEYEKADGIEISSGSLGHGPAIGAGIAHAAKLNKQELNVYVIVGDGEVNEGSVWEALLCASQLKLDNFYLIIDNNGMESLDKTNNILSIEPIDKKLEAFNFEVERFNGNNFDEIHLAVERLKNKKSPYPKAMIADTTKGYGISFTANQTKWHARSPTDEELKLGLTELDKTINA